MYTIAQTPMLTSYAQTQQMETRSSVASKPPHLKRPHAESSRRASNSSSSSGAEQDDGHLPPPPHPDPMMGSEANRVANARSQGANTMVQPRKLRKLQGSAKPTIVRYGGFSRLDDRPGEVRQIRQKKHPVLFSGGLELFGFSFWRSNGAAHSNEGSAGVRQGVRQIS